MPEVRSADPISRWLVISRACVVSMTLSSALIGVLLALEKGAVSWLAAVLCTVGLLAAHLSNNMLNDWTDTRRGVDTEDYPRVQYSTHPLLGGLTTPARLLAASLVLLGLAAGVMAALVVLRGWPVAVFALAGLALSLSYTGLLKRHGLGELAALLAWGPLMIAGTAYACSGRLRGLVLPGFPAVRPGRGLGARGQAHRQAGRRPEGGSPLRAGAAGGGTRPLRHPGPVRCLLRPDPGGWPPCG